MTQLQEDQSRQVRWDMALRDRIEDHFRDWAYVAGRRRAPIIVGMLVLAFVNVEEGRLAAQAANREDEARARDSAQAS